MLIFHRIKTPRIEPNTNHELYNNNVLVKAIKLVGAFVCFAFEVTP